MFFTESKRPAEAQGSLSGLRVVSLFRINELKTRSFFSIWLLPHVLDIDYSIAFSYEQQHRQRFRYCFTFKIRCQGQLHAAAEFLTHAKIEKYHRVSLIC